MGIFSRLSDIVNSNINTMLDKAEDPEKIIRLMIQEMEDTLVEVRSGAVRFIADKKEMERRISALEGEMEEWERKAEFALSREREDLARGALAAKARLGGTLATLLKQCADLDEALAKQNHDVARLQERLDEAKAREKALQSRHQVASARLKVREHLYDDRINDAFARFESVERSLDKMEGKVESYDLGRGKTLTDEFLDLETEKQVDDSLAQLKTRLKKG